MKIGYAFVLLSFAGQCRRNILSFTLSSFSDIAFSLSASFVLSLFSTRQLEQPNRLYFTMNYFHLVHTLLFVYSCVYVTQLHFSFIHSFRCDHYCSLNWLGSARLNSSHRVIKRREKLWISDILLNSTIIYMYALYLFSSANSERSKIVFMIILWNWPLSWLMLLLLLLLPSFFFMCVFRSSSHHILWNSLCI